MLFPKMVDVCQRSWIQAVAMSYLKKECCATRMEGVSIESVYRKFVISSKNEGMECELIERVKHSNLR